MSTNNLSSPQEQALSRERPARRGRTPGRMVRQSIGPRIVLIVICVLYALPFFWMVVTALKPTHELSIYPPTVLPKAPAWDNFSQAINFIPFPTFMLNSLILAVGTAVGAAISNPLIAYGFSRIKWPGRDLVFGIVMATIFIPFPVVMVALFDIFAKLHWINTFLPLIVPAFFGNPFYIFLMRQFFMQLPSELNEAARIDGAREFQIFTRVIMPLAKPAVAVVVIFAAVAAWNEFLLPLIYLQDESKYPLAIGIQFFRGEHNVAYNLLMAASALIVLPVLGFFLIFQRFFIEGVTVGSVKG